VPLHIVAADVADGSELRLSRGSVVDAVMASAAIPGVFSPVSLDGRRLMDGGVSNNTLISHALELGADEVYVLPTGHPCSLQRAPKGALAMLLHAMALLVQQRLVREIELLRDEARLIVLPPPCPLDVQPIDFGRARELIDRARTDGRAFPEEADEARVPFSMRVERLRPQEHAAAGAVP
jgi:NTE family protein